ncbi:YggT family protein [Heyndrickxia ginsengihumi]|uniref:Membrane protein n=1 Tax=Heyndrickxia ginsengihumi TaxID=363870 RepID=A0A0A6VHU8_9BACI|nr:YggT family protein [Heyndrickxia ginsengihumi]KHD86204.1 membrane protein [Heyndrickxia ginsengihumi]MBE6183435.1 YggT family protein [Bacillus sp. (in: firmicutes)]MCM3022418.1 YggT family protein [Heyndrickxia ginsengihumi]NEY18639.1 YggT family protein [Heyndrickxia ginsengihumi]
MGMILHLLLTLIQLYSYVIIIYVFLSWFNIRDSAVGQFLARLAEPYLEQFRRIIPPLGMIDISPIVALIVLELASYGLKTLFSWFM